MDIKDNDIDLKKENHINTVDSDDIKDVEALDHTDLDHADLDDTDLDDTDLDDTDLDDTDLDDTNLDDDSDKIDYNEDSDGSHKKNNHKGKKNLSLGNVIRYLIMIIAAIVFLYSGFMLAKIYLEYKQGDDIYKSIADTVLVPVEVATTDNAEEKQLPFKYDHQALLNINSEGVGYLYIPSINVQLPLAQGSDNDYYLTHTFNRNYNGAGALFEDYRITNGLAASHVIIYGHNMKNGSMFAGLSKYLTPSFYQTQGNDIFYIYTGNKLLEYKIFTAYISEPISNTYTYNFSNVSSLQDYAQSMKQLSSYNTGVDVSLATQIVTFSTCTSDGTQRIIVQGTFISESPLE